MKLKLIIVLLLGSLSISAQDTDTLRLVRQSRIAYCNSKIEEVAIQKVRLQSKDAEIVIFNSRIESKDQEIASFKREQSTYITELQLEKGKTTLVTDQNKQLAAENKQLKKKGFIKTVCIWAIVGVVIVIEIFKA